MSPRSFCRVGTLLILPSPSQPLTPGSSAPPETTSTSGQSLFLPFLTSLTSSHPSFIARPRNRIWDVRHLSNLTPNASSNDFLAGPSDDENPPSPRKAPKLEDGATPPPPPPAEEEIVETWPTANFLGDEVKAYASTSKGKGLVQGAYRHGKSCSSAVWDP